MRTLNCLYIFDKFYTSRLNFGNQVNCCHFKIVKINVMFITLFLNVYTIIAILVQDVDSADLHNVSENLNIPLSNAFPKSKRRSIRDFVSNKNYIHKDGLLMENLYEKRYRRNVTEPDNITDSTLNQLKRALSKFLLTRNKHSNKRDVHLLSGLKFNKKDVKRNDHKKSEGNQKWNNWTKWSACSVTCGKGREIRWRHCKTNCKDVEIEMEEKACQLPACPQKLFGIIKL